MGTGITFTKQLGAASSNNVATSQSASAGVPLTLNGSATNYLSTTTTAAVLPGGVVLPLSSVSGLTVGQAVTDTTATALVAATTIQGIGTSGVTIFPPVGGVNGVGSGDTIVFPGTAIIDTATAANSAIGRRVVIAYTGTDTSFAIVGTNATGNVITDIAVGSGGSAQSNLDFVTVTSITPVGGGLTGVTAGTNGVGSSPWWFVNTLVTSVVDVAYLVEVVSGSVNFSIQHTFDDPNNLTNGLNYPIPIIAAGNLNLTATSDGVFNDFPITGLNILINSGTGELRVRFTQSGIG